MLTSLCELRTCGMNVHTTFGKCVTLAPAHQSRGLTVPVYRLYEGVGAHWEHTMEKRKLNLEKKTVHSLLHGENCICSAAKFAFCCVLSMDTTKKKEMKVAASCFISGINIRNSACLRLYRGMRWEYYCQALGGKTLHGFWKEGVGEQALCYKHRRNKTYTLSFHLLSSVKKGFGRE